MNASPAPLASVPSRRMMSLDVFRGATIASMMLVNNPGSNITYVPLEHADWSGWTFTDTVFPFFLWIVGVAMTLSFARRIERGDSRGALFFHIFRRFAIIFGIGLFLNGFPYFPWDHLRYAGVLQRIAICYLVAGTIFIFTRVRGVAVSIVALLSVYWLLMAFYPVPGIGADRFAKEANLERYSDGIVLAGHMYSGSRYWDPEGLVSTLPSIATALFGVLLGYLLRSNRTPEQKTAWMFFSGNVLILLGLLLSPFIPINKNLWTSSYSIFMAGLASVVFASYYWIVDVHGYRKWARPLAIYGMNAIAVYILSGLIGRLLGIITVAGTDGRPQPLENWIFNTLFAPWASPINASLFYAIAIVLFYYLIAWFFYRRSWFLRF